MSKKDIDKLRVMIEVASEMAGAVFDAVGHVDTIWVFEQGDGVVASIDTPWASPEEKADYVAFIKMLFAALGVKRYALLTEGWMLHIPAGDGKEIDMRNVPRPSTSPDRVEVVSIMAGDHTYTYKGTFRAVIRPADGPAHLGPLHPLTTTMGGNLYGILGEPPKH